MPPQYPVHGPDATSPSPPGGPTQPPAGHPASPPPPTKVEAEEKYFVGIAATTIIALSPLVGGAKALLAAVVVDVVLGSVLLFKSRTRPDGVAMLLALIFAIPLLMIVGAGLCMQALEGGS